MRALRSGAPLRQACPLIVCPSPLPTAPKAHQLEHEPMSQKWAPEVPRDTEPTRYVAPRQLDAKSGRPRDDDELPPLGCRTFRGGLGSWLGATRGTVNRQAGRELRVPS